MKNKILSAAAIICSLICINQSYALTVGQEGHGGDVVVKDGKVRFLDLAENRPEFYDPSKESYYFQSVSKKILFVWSKLAVSVVYPHQMTWIFTDEHLENIEDEGVIITKLDGSLEQVAVQKNNVVLINKPLFSKLSETDKAALLVHEALIRAAIYAGLDLKSKVGTAPIRKIVAILFSENAEAVTNGYYQHIWNELPPLQQ